MNSKSRQKQDEGRSADRPSLQHVSTRSPAGRSGKPPKKPRSADRKTSYRFGIIAEWVAMIWLWCKGYRILAWRHRNPGGEIDIAARTRNTLAIIEVKARQTQDAALHAVDHHKQQRLARAGLHFMQQHNFTGLQPRFDLMVIRPWRLPIHIPNAWHDSTG